MTDHNPSAGNAPVRPNSKPENDNSWPTGFRKRLAQFAERTNTTPPARPFEGEGDDRTFSAEFLAYSQETGLSLDWVYFGDAMPLVMREHHAAKREAEKPASFAEQRDPYHRAYQVQALLRCAMLAEENECSGLEWKGTAAVLQLAEEIMEPIIDHIDFASRKGGTK